MDQASSQILPIEHLYGQNPLIMPDQLMEDPSQDPGVYTIKGLVILILDSVYMNNPDSFKPFI
jgi:hypothetical protein